MFPILKLPASEKNPSRKIVSDATPLQGRELGAELLYGHGEDRSPVMKAPDAPRAGESEVMEWLLEPEEPASRYGALVSLLGKGEESEEVRRARAAISERGWAAGILRKQKPQGFWESRDNLYRPKYTATIWNLIVLADLGMTAKDERVRRPCEFFLAEYSRPDGGFDTPSSDWKRSELCLTGNLARTLSLCGYMQDPKVTAAFDWLVENQMEDGGWHSFYEKAFGKGTLDCWEGLSAFAVFPKSLWTRRIKRSVERGVEFYLQKELHRQGARRYAPWYRFHYPVHYYYDILVGLDVMTKLGYADDKRLDFALTLLKEKRRPDGTWVLERLHPDLGTGAGYRLRKGVTPLALEEEGAPSKWITLTCLQVLKRVEEAR